MRQDVAPQAGSSLEAGLQGVLATPTLSGTIRSGYMLGSIQISKRNPEDLLRGDQMMPPDQVRRRYADVLDPSQLAAMDVLFGLRACVQSVDTVVARWLGPDALTPGRFQIMILLWSASAPLLQRDLVNRLGVTRATISGLVAALEKDGLVTLSAGTADKRQVLVELTTSGTETIKRLVASTTTKLRHSFGMLSDEELRLLSSQLTKVVGSIKSSKPS